MYFETDHDPAPAELKALTNNLVGFNLGHIEVDRRVPLAIWCRDGKQEKIGGITGNTFGKWLEIKILWGDERYRGMKVGTTLLHEMEKNAKSRGCCQILVDTYDFQARPFYEKNGYTVLFTLDDYPCSGKRHYLIKRY